MEEKKKPDTPTIPLLWKCAIGSFSGSIATTVIQPADLVKTRMQLKGPKRAHMTPMEVARGIVAQNGILGLYQGYSAALMRQILYSGGRLGVFNEMLERYQEKYHKPPNLGIKVMMGMAGGSVGNIISMPAEVALIRMTADGRLPIEKQRNYKHVFHALYRMATDEGYSSFLKGIWPTVARSVLGNGAQLATYAECREAFLIPLGSGTANHFGSSIISGFVATVVSQPMDMIKTRIQNAKGEATQLGVLTKIVKTKGVFGLWSGFMPAYMKIAPHTVISFMIMEQCNAFFLKYNYR